LGRAVTPARPSARAPRDSTRGESPSGGSHRPEDLSSRKRGTGRQSRGQRHWGPQGRLGSFERPDGHGATVRGREPDRGTDRPTGDRVHDRRLTTPQAQHNLYVQTTFSTEGRGMFPTKILVAADGYKETSGAVRAAAVGVGGGRTVSANTNLYATPQDVVVTPSTRTAPEGRPRTPGLRIIQDLGYELRRITLPKLFGKSGCLTKYGSRRRPIGVERASIGRFLPPTKHTGEAFGYFPNSFSTHSAE